MVLARARLAAGDRSGGIAALRRALELARGIPQPERSRHLLAFARVEMAEALVADDPAAAEALVAEVGLDSVEELGLTAALVRAEAALRHGRPAEAEAGLRGAIERSRRERRAFAELRDRDAFFARRESLHLALVRLLMDQAREEEALEALESWRAESLDRQFPVEGDGAEASLVTRLGAHAGTAFYSLLSLPDELWVWRLTAGGLLAARHPLPRADLERLVERAVEEVRVGGGGEASRRLVGLVLGEAGAQESGALVISADPVTFGIPFAAMPLPAAGGRLVDRFEIEVPPGLRQWLARRESLAAPAGCALLIQGAADGGDLAPGLPRLRTVQRRQLKASLRWAARLLDLPAPAWVSAVADEDPSDERAATG